MSSGSNRTPSCAPSSPAAAILLAAGNSSRLFASDPELRARKPLLELGGEPLFLHAYRALRATRSIVELVVVVHADDRAQIVELLPEETPHIACTVVEGGEERTDSVRAGVRATSSAVALVAIHDAARPLVSPAAIERCLLAAEASGAALLALPVEDSLKRVDAAGHVSAHVPREGLWRAQTPQCFRREPFLAVLAAAERAGDRPTDDAALWERYQGPVTVVAGEEQGFKITTRADLELARALWHWRGRPEVAQNSSCRSTS